MTLPGSLAALFVPAHGKYDLVVRLLLGLAFSVLVLALAHRFLRTRGRRTLIVGVTFLGGLFFALEYFWPVHTEKGQEVNFLTSYIEPAALALSVAGAFTVGLGVHSLMQVHGRTLRRRRSGWHNSLAFFLSMVAMFVFTLWDFYAKSPTPTGTRPFHNAIQEVLFNGIYQPLTAATFSLLAFYIASAAYRAFRIRSAEAALMMAAAFLVMLAQVPLGAWLTQGLPKTGYLGIPNFFRLENFGNWILTWWNAPAQRGILFGVAVGALAMSLRIWLSLERGTFFADQPEAGNGTPSLAGSKSES